MFESATLSYDSSGKRTFATFVGFTGQAALVACAFLIPMIAPQTLPRVAWITTIAPPLPPLPPPPGPSVQPQHGATLRASEARIFMAPTNVPAYPRHRG